MAAQTRELELLLTVNDRTSRALNNIGKNTEKLNQRTGQLSGAVKGLVGAYIGVQGLKFALNSTVGAAVRWEDAFAGVRKTVDATEEQFQGLNKELREMATRIPVSAVELANIGEVAGQLGVDAENITAFTETVAKLGVATTLTAEEAASDLARIANIMQLPLDQVGRMGSVLVELGNNFATTEREIDSFALRIAGAGKIAGLATSDIFAIGAALSSVGVQAEAGGTAVQKVLLAINESVVNGTEKMEIFAQTAGLSGREFAEVWERDAGKAFTAFVEGLGEQGDQAITTLQELGLEDQRLIRSFLSLANAGDLLERAMSSANSEFQTANALNEEAAKRFETTASQVQLMENNMNELGIIMGDAFLPTMNEGIEVLIGFAQGWAGANENILATFDSFSSFMEVLKEFPGALADVGSQIGTTLQSVPLLGMLFKGIGNIGANVIGAFTGGTVTGGNILGQSVEFRANGGPVSAGRPYVVGERGPELFVPSGSGSIAANGTGGMNVNVTVNGDVSGRELVRKVQDGIMSGLRQNMRLNI